MDGRGLSRWSASTVSNTHSIVECHLKPHLGHLHLVKLTTADAYEVGRKDEVEIRGATQLTHAREYDIGNGPKNRGPDNPFKFSVMADGGGRPGYDGNRQPAIFS
jgi:hypothetical protein